MDNRRTYKGKENPISLSRFYSTEFFCKFDMSWYPFDTQRCSIDLVLDEKFKNFLEFEMESLNFLGQKDLTLYFVKKVSHRKIKIDGIDSIIIETILRRRLFSLIMTIFIPTIVLNLVGHLSNLFKEDYFEATIALNVTVMLVLTTMFTSVSESLPKTSYIKMIDSWLLVSLIKPFLDMLSQTYIEHYRMDE